MRRVLLVCVSAFLVFLLAASSDAVTYEDKSALGLAALDKELDYLYMCQEVEMAKADVVIDDFIAGRINAESAKKKLSVIDGTLWDMRSNLGGMRVSPQYKPGYALWCAARDTARNRADLIADALTLIDSKSLNNENLLYFQQREGQKAIEGTRRWIRARQEAARICSSSSSCSGDMAVYYMWADKLFNLQLRQLEMTEQMREILTYSVHSKKHETNFYKEAADLTKRVRNANVKGITPTNDRIFKHAQSAVAKEFAAFEKLAQAFDILAAKGANEETLARVNRAIVDFRESSVKMIDNLLDAHHAALEDKL